jgi:hypothetical protein
MAVMEQLVGGAAHSLLHGTAEHPAGGGIDEGDPAFTIDAIQAVGGGFQDARGAGFGGQQLAGALLHQFFQVQAVAFEFGFRLLARR